MANLINCKDCGKEVSKKAKTCPHCGAKVKKGHKILWTILGIFGLFVIIGIFSEEENGTTSSANNSSDKELNSAPSSTGNSSKAPKKPKLELLEGWEITTGEFGNTSIIGKVKNNTSKEYSYAQITFNLYDDSKALVGTAVANINNFEPDGIWKFSAICLENEFKTAKFKEVTGF